MSKQPPSSCEVPGAELLANGSQRRSGKFDGSAQDEEESPEPPLTLNDLLTLALVPSSVPAGVLILALAIAGGLGTLPPALRSCFEQIAGGALLITYLKEIFPRVMERLDEAVERLGPTTVATRREKHRRWFGLILLVVVTTILSVVVQAWFEHWPGLRIVKATESGAASTAPRADPAAGGVWCVQQQILAKAGRSSSGKVFTPGDTVPYFLGFIVDGVVLAYDDNRIQCNGALVKRLVLSSVLAVDNFLDGFGLAPVLRDAFHEAWWAIMLLFACCVLVGATFTALLRWVVPDESLVHTVWFAFSTLSILDGAMELCQAGLTLYVVLGMSVTWLFLFLGDAADDEVVDADDDVSTPTLTAISSQRA